MKKILWCGVAYVALAVVQLICVIVCLFAQTAPMSKAMIQTVLLLLSVVPLMWGDVLLQKYRQQLDEAMLGMVYLVQNQVSLTLSAAVVNLLVSLVQILWARMPGWIPALAAIYLVAAWAVAGGERCACKKIRRALENRFPRKFAGGAVKEEPYAFRSAH